MRKAGLERAGGFQPFQVARLERDVDAAEILLELVEPGCPDDRGDDAGSRYKRSGAAQQRSPYTRARSSRLRERSAMRCILRKLHKTGTARMRFMTSERATGGTWLRSPREPDP